MTKPYCESDRALGDNDELTDMEQLYFENDEDVAAYLNMSLEQFLKLRNAGKFCVTPRARDPVLVWWREDIDAWLAAGRPPFFMGREGL